MFHIFQYHLISPDLDAASLTFDRDSDWFFLRLNPVRVDDHDGQERVEAYLYRCPLGFLAPVGVLSIAQTHANAHARI